MLLHMEKNKSYSWCFNVSLLLNIGFQQMLKSEINVYIETDWSSVSSVSLVWEAVLRRWITQYASFIKKSKAQSFVELEGNIKSVESELKCRMSSDDLRELSQLKCR